MNTPEGIRRIATAIRWLGDGTGALLAIGGIGLAIATKGESDSTFLFWAGLILGAVLAGAGRLLSWIINGFAEPKSPGG